MLLFLDFFWLPAGNGISTPIKYLPELDFFNGNFLLDFDNFGRNSPLRSDGSVFFDDIFPPLLLDVITNNLKAYNNSILYILINYLKYLPERGFSNVIFSPLL